MKWICEYAEFDTDLRNPRECEPFCFNADSYEEARKKANEYLSDYYDLVEYAVREADEDELEYYEYIDE